MPPEALTPDPTRHAWAKQAVSKDFIPWKGGRPERETVINDEDICNLKIALGTAQSLEHFLEVV